MTGSLKTRGSKVKSLEDDSKINKNPATDGVRMWGRFDDVYFGVREATKTLPSGFYHVNWDGQKVVLKQSEIFCDGLLTLTDSTIPKILTEFQKFWTLQDEFIQRGFLHKRGLMLHGDPGTGKTSTVNLIITEIIKLGGIAVYIQDPALADDGLEMIRRIEPDRPIVTIMEDIDDLIECYGESKFLSILDGEKQVNNIMHLATTNYLERIDPRFVNRPSRFDVIIKVEPPTAEARRQYLITKEPTLSAQEVDRWVQNSEGFSISHLKELIIGVKCFGKPEEEVLAALDKMMNNNKEHSEFGFHSKKKSWRVDDAPTSSYEKGSGRR